ncbi:aspartyl-phosphate phosphatase Spo0E family protein [Paenibacillus oralis]|nr:aspartyl-phosphate phosphatase Spo0E family protein [Paenibacillus oralis]
MLIEKKQERNITIDSNRAESLRQQFTTLQKEMVNLGMELGLSHPSVIRISQELDEVHNQMLRARV